MSSPPNYNVRSYKPSNPGGAFPYITADLTPLDTSSDASFYSQPRFVTHIDDAAIIALKQYYDAVLPDPSKSTNRATNSAQPVRILDICSSWISHYPPRITSPAANSSPTSPLQVYGTGMSQHELAANPVLNPTPSGKALDSEADARARRWWVQDLNVTPELAPPAHLIPPLPIEEDVDGVFDATTCVVSIDYLTSPVRVLQSVRKLTRRGGTVHLVVSNRCFPTKAVGRWLKVGEEERLEMVGDYLWWAGWRELEIVEIVKAGRGWRGGDPLWVVRGVKTGEGDID